jgi:Fe-S cluster biogenesis protein NfuA
MTEELTIEVHKALEEIRPFLNSDGGDITYYPLKMTSTLNVLKDLYQLCKIK